MKPSQSLKVVSGRYSLKRHVCTSQSSLHNLCNILLITIKKEKSKSILKNQDPSCFFRDALLRFRHICVFIEIKNQENTF